MKLNKIIGIFGSLIIIALIFAAPKIDAKVIASSLLSVGALLLVTKPFENNSYLTTRDLTEMAIFIAAAVVLDMPFFKIRLMANGGSISLVMLPLLILSLRKGFIKGFISSGIVFGLITCFFDGYGFVTYPFDYLLGFGSLALIGFFRPLIFNNKNRLTIKSVIFLVFSMILAISTRLLFSTISGMIFYGLNFGGSLVYNVTYLLPSSIFVLIGILLLFPSILKLEKKK